MKTTIRRLLLLALIPLTMAPMCEDSPSPPCTKRLHPDDPMDTFLYPGDCRESAGSADGADAGVP